LFAGTCGQDTRATDVLVALSRVDIESDDSLNALFEFTLFRDLFNLADGFLSGQFLVEIKHRGCANFLVCACLGRRFLLIEDTQDIILIEG
jgi:hypothetical protein